MGECIVGSTSFEEQPISLFFVCQKIQIKDCRETVIFVLLSWMQDWHLLTKCSGSKFGFLKSDVRRVWHLIVCFWKEWTEKMRLKSLERWLNEYQWIKMVQIKMEETELNDVNYMSCKESMRYYYYYYCCAFIAGIYYGVKRWNF